MESSTFHVNSRNYARSEVYGNKLSVGDEITEKDVMDSWDGTWRRVPQELVGQRVQENPGAVFIRKIQTT